MTITMRPADRRGGRTCAALLTAALLLAAPTVGAQDASPWIQGLHSRVRLVAGGQADGRYLAGVELALDKGFKTYWRHPGESGLPPRFDWAGSVNTDAVVLRWPAPTRTEDAGGVSHVYLERVLFPIEVKPLTANQPVRLELAFDYGICKDICIPAHATLGLTLSGAGAEGGRIAAALAHVPKAQALGAEGALAILAMEPLSGGKPGFNVSIRSPAGSRPTLFTEAPDHWFLSTSAEAEPIASGRSRFVVKVEERPKAAAGPVPLRFTLVAGEQAIETEVEADLAAPRP